MTTLHQVRAPVKPEVCWLDPPLWPCTLFPHGRPGQVLLNDKLYAVLPLDDESGHTYAFALARAGQEEPYQVNTTDWKCDCADSVYRERTCKHSHLIRDSFEGRLS
jgi:hypothetical protein